MKILVTGTSTGFGKLIAESLIKEGHDVAATMRGVGGKNRASAEALEKAGAKVVELDVADETSADKGVQDSIEALGGLEKNLRPPVSTPATGGSPNEHRSPAGIELQGRRPRAR